MFRVTDPHLGYWIDELAAYVGTHREAEALKQGGAGAPDTRRIAPAEQGAIIRQVGRDMVINGTVPIIHRDDL